MKKYINNVKYIHILRLNPELDIKMHNILVNVFRVPALNLVKPK